MKLLSSSILIHPLGLQYRLSKMTSCSTGHYSSVTTALWLGKRCLEKVKLSMWNNSFAWMFLVLTLSYKWSTLCQYCRLFLFFPTVPWRPTFPFYRPLLSYWWQLTDHPFIKIWKCSFALAPTQDTSITCCQILIGFLDLRD